jgi:hypothetical protein
MRAIIQYSATAESKEMRGAIREAMNPKGQRKLFAKLRPRNGPALYEANAPLAEIAKALGRIARVVEQYGARSSPPAEAIDQLWVCLYNPAASD